MCTTARTLHGLFAGLQERLEGELRSDRHAFTHPGARGEASEEGWLSILRDHLPHRYRADRAQIVDSTGRTSDQIDVVIYDRQYSPLLYNNHHQHFVPAESVYAVFEVKQKLNREHLLYAAEKAASVRRLSRTSAEIRHAGGTFEPQPPHRIAAGILTYRSNWKTPFGAPFREILDELQVEGQLDLGCVLTGGTFEATYRGGGEVAVESTDGHLPLVQFLFRLLRRLQAMATAPAIDYGRYLEALDHD